MVSTPGVQQRFPDSDTEGAILIQDPAYQDSFESQRPVFTPLMSPAPFPDGGEAGIYFDWCISLKLQFVR